MTGSDPKADLHRYLQSAREALPWKLDALALDAIGHVPWWPPDQNEVTRLFEVSRDRVAM